MPRVNGYGPFAEKPYFQVLGSPFSLFNASIPSKAILYTRRGTLVGINGDFTSITSTLSIFNGGVLQTATQLFSGIPFLYQKLEATEPFTALIGTKADATSFAVLDLDGRYDWNLIAKSSLLSWCGLQAQARQFGLGKSLLRTSMLLTGRGSAVVAGNGQIYQVVLQPGESYIVNAQHIIGYAESCPEPQQIKLQSLSISLTRRLPSLSNFLLKYEFFRVMSVQPFWIYTKRFGKYIRKLVKTAIWGDQSFVRFQGPTTILLQSRTKFSSRGESEQIDAKPIEDTQSSRKEQSLTSTPFAGSLKLASVNDGKVTLVDTKSFV